MPELNFHTEGKTVVSEWGSTLKGKTVVITGASEKSLGASTATHLAHANPSTILLLARSEPKVKPVIDSIKDINPSIKSIFIPVELDYFDSVRAAAKSILEKVEKIDVLINNAGVMAIPWAQNKNGIEKTFAINHLGHFLLTKLLMPAVLAGGGGRIVNLTSAAYKMAPVDFGDLNFSDGATYNRFAAYGQSKTANILFTKGLARRFEKQGVRAYAVHPGYIPGTSLVSHLPELDGAEMDRVAREKTGIEFAADEPKTQEEGVATTLVAALSPDLEDHNGAYLSDCQVTDVREYAKGPELVERLWKVSEELVGETF
ncbi:hypothetical protein BJY04DRAFT_229895 [Aspergillus karnatakaensis]|uniref:uncharacterized protein n=1 Tax=Aspergillus karnatakaensis TaxID=1810916 RepID=UPI003CCE0655